MFPAVSHTAYADNSSALTALKGQISCPLEGQFPDIPFREHPILRTGNGKLHPVSAFNLEGHIVGSGSRGMVSVRASGICVVVVRNVGSFCHDFRRDSQARGIVVFIPGSDTSYRNDDEISDNKHKCNKEYYLKHIKPHLYHPISHKFCRKEYKNEPSAWFHYIKKCHSLQWDSREIWRKDLRKAK